MLIYQAPSEKFIDDVRENTISDIMWAKCGKKLKHNNHLKQLLPAFPQFLAENSQHGIFFAYFKIEVFLGKTLMHFKEFFFPGFPVSSFIRFHGSAVLFFNIKTFTTKTHPGEERLQNSE
jgi:hypothetical protein